MNVVNEYIYRLIKTKKGLENKVDRLYAIIYLVAGLAIIEAVIVLGLLVATVTSQENRMFSKHKQLVFDILSDYEHTRDNDRELVIIYWKRELANKGIHYEGKSFQDFFDLLLDGVVTISDSITRTRRKIQQDNKHLRGAMYEPRQEEIQDEAIEDVQQVWDYGKPDKQVDI